MILFYICAYTALAGLGAIIAEATESKLGQHLGMGALVYCTSAFLLPYCFRQDLWMDNELGVWLGRIVTGVLIGLLAFISSFAVYSVNSSQALRIGATICIGHVLLIAFAKWATSMPP